MTETPDPVRRADELLEQVRHQEQHKLEAMAATPARPPWLARNVPLSLAIAAVGLVVAVVAVLAFALAVAGHANRNSSELQRLHDQVAEQQRVRQLLEQAVRSDDKLAAALAADNRRLAARNAQLLHALTAAGVPVPAPTGAAAGDEPTSRRRAGPSSSPSASSSPQPSPSPSSRSPTPRPSPSPSPTRTCLVRDPTTGRCLVPGLTETTDQPLEALVTFRLEKVPAGAGMYAHGRLRSPRLGIAHATVSPMGPPNAKGVARFFGASRPSAPSSAHVTVDGGGIGYRSVDDGDTAYAAPGANGDGLHLELCAIPTHDRDAGRKLWTSDKGLATLEDGAHVMGRWVVKYQLPVRWLTVAELRSGMHGLADHWVCTQALGGSHWDVGAGFPVARWLDLVGNVADRIRHAERQAPAPTHPVPLPDGAPAFPLPAGHYFGRPSSSAYCHSGYYGAGDAHGVELLQRRLVALGYLHTRDVDGRYGAGTEAAVRAAQRANRLRVDGRVGAYSWHGLWLHSARHA